MRKTKLLKATAMLSAVIGAYFLGEKDRQIIPTQTIHTEDELSRDFGMHPLTEFKMPDNLDVDPYDEARKIKLEMSMGIGLPSKHVSVSNADDYTEYSAISVTNDKATEYSASSAKKERITLAKRTNDCEGKEIILDLERRTLVSVRQLARAEHELCKYVEIKNPGKEYLNDARRIAATLNANLKGNYSSTVDKNDN